MTKPSIKTMVAVSAIAVIAMPMKIAHAIITINCTQNIGFGTILPNCTGSITVRATAASGTANNGCHTFIGGVIRAGVCNIVETAGGTATMNGRITFTTPAFQFSNTAAAGQVTLDNYRLQTGAGSAVNTFTYNSTLINPTHTFKIGGRLRFDNAETAGTYNSAINVVVTAIP